MFSFLTHLLLVDHGAFAQTNAVRDFLRGRTLNAAALPESIRDVPELVELARANAGAPGFGPDGLPPGWEDGGTTPEPPPMFAPDDDELLGWFEDGDD